MRTGFPLLSKLLTKLIEIVGAGLASAAGAFLLGHIAAAPVPAPVVQIVPASADAIRMAHGQPAMVGQVDVGQVDVGQVDVGQVDVGQVDVGQVDDDLSNQDLSKAGEKTAAVTPATTEVAPATASVKIDKVAREGRTAGKPLPVRREHKAEAQHATAGGQVRENEVPVRIVPREEKAAHVIPVPTGEVVDISPPQPASAASQGGFRLLATLRQIPAWLLPNLDSIESAAPRPPQPVGQFWQSTM